MACQRSGRSLIRAFDVGRSPAWTCCVARPHGSALHRTFRPRSPTHSRRREFAGARFSRRRGRAVFRRARGRAQTSGTSTATNTSTTSAPGVRRFSATRPQIVIEAVRERRRATASASAFPIRSKWRWPKLICRLGAVDREGAHGEQRHGGHHVVRPPGARFHRSATRSSSSTAAITATSMRCSCRPAAARSPTASRTAPACPPSLRR